MKDFDSVLFGPQLGREMPINNHEEHFKVPHPPFNRHSRQTELRPSRDEALPMEFLERLGDSATGTGANSPRGFFSAAFTNSL
jgi:hypothetical protein